MGDKQGDKHRWLVSELRARSFDETDCYKEEGVAVVVRTDREAVFYAYWFERQWYLGACARRGVTYVLPDGGDVVAACVEWAAGWRQTMPAETFGAAAPPEVVERFGLRQLSRAEMSAWFDAIGRAMKRLILRRGGEP